VSFLSSQKRFFIRQTDARAKKKNHFPSFKASFFMLILGRLLLLHNSIQATLFLLIFLRRARPCSKRGFMYLCRKKRRIVRERVRPRWCRYNRESERRFPPKFISPLTWSSDLYYYCVRRRHGEKNCK
jgi:hypothetical protein